MPWSTYFFLLIYIYTKRPKYKAWINFIEHQFQFFPWEINSCVFEYVKDFYTSDKIMQINFHYLLTNVLVMNEKHVQRELFMLTPQMQIYEPLILLVGHKMLAFAGGTFKILILALWLGKWSCLFMPPKPKKNIYWLYFVIYKAIAMIARG